jgi:hypothetical protein
LSLADSNSDSCSLMTGPHVQRAAGVDPSEQASLRRILLRTGPPLTSSFG